MLTASRRRPGPSFHKQGLIAKIGQYFAAVVVVVVVVVLAQSDFMQLRGRELNPGLPRDKRKY